MPTLIISPQCCNTQKCIAVVLLKSTHPTTYLCGDLRKIFSDVFWYPTWGRRLVSTMCLQCYNIQWCVLLSNMGQQTGCPMLERCWLAGLGGLVGFASDWWSGGCWLPEIDHEIFSTAILSLPLIKEEHLSVSGERMCTILVNRFED